MQKLKNVLNKCLIKADPEQLVGEVLQLPELHLLIEVSNHYYKRLDDPQKAGRRIGRSKLGQVGEVSLSILVFSGSSKKLSCFGKLFRLLPCPF